MHPSAKRRLRLTLLIVVLGMLTTFAIAPGLFLHRPFLGPVPVAGWIPDLPSHADTATLLILAGLLIPTLWLRDPRPLLLAWCAIFFLRCCWDRLTWQPYLLQYSFILFALACVDWRNEHENSQRQTAVLNTLRLILVCIYFWSGISKLNYASMVLGPQQLLSTFESDALIRILSFLFFVAPIVEVAFALGLLTRRFRKLSIVLAILMHLAILTIYGPLGFEYNPVVWPWNVAMVALLLLLFRADRETSAGKILWVPRFVLHPIALVVFALCPLLSYAGFWSEYLSFRLYSHSYHHAAILMRQSAIDSLPVEIREHVQPSGFPDWDGVLHVSHWGERQLNAFPPTDVAVSKHIAREICRNCPAPADMRVVIRYPPHPITGEAQHKLVSCNDLEMGYR